MHAINRLIQTSAHVENWLLLYTDSLEQSPSWEADILSGSQKIRLVLWTLKVHYLVHIRPLPEPIIRLIPVHTHTLSSGSILILSCHLHAGISFKLSLSFSCIVTTTRPAHPVVSGRINEILLNLLKAKLNPICHLLALVGAHHIFHVSRVRVKDMRCRITPAPNNR